MGTDIHGRLQLRTSPTSPYRDEGVIETERNYRVFALLAGVRNGTGFAGVRTHTPITPISEPRGIPGDLIDDVDGDDMLTLRNWMGEPITGEGYWLGDHSHSWLSLKEIVEWDGWNKTLKTCGYVKKDEWARCIVENDTPNEWCGGVSGDTSSYEYHEWENPFSTQASLFKAWLDYVWMKYEWRTKDDPDAVRIVFGFDS